MVPETPEDQLTKHIERVTKESNNTEKLISLQLLTLATFVVTAIGAFIVSNHTATLSIGTKVFLLLDIICLFFSLGFGIIHLLVIRNMWLQSVDDLHKARKIFPFVDKEESQAKMFNEVFGERGSATMIFFYLQLSSLAIGITIFLGMIITLLF
jgi:hypothetical protein